MPETLDRLDLDVTRGYAPEPRPLAGYAGIAGTFGLAVAGMALAAKTKPEAPLRARDLLLLGVATYRLSRLLAKDAVTSFLRAPFTTYQGASEMPNEVEETSRGQGARRAIGELLVCPFCVGTWVAGGLVGGMVLAPRLTRALAAGLAVETVGDVLNMAHIVAWRRMSGS
jgi:hypothetical protein